MNIIDVLKSKIASVANTEEQAVSEKLIELATFFYKIDMRISLAEQNYMDQFLKSIEWKSSIHIESFQQRCIAKVNDVIGESEVEIGLFLSDLMKQLAELGAADRAKLIAKEISDADGEIADHEVKYLDIVMCYE